MAAIKKYRLLAVEFRARADLPGLATQRGQLLSYATYFEKCADEAERTRGLSLGL